MLVSSAPQRVDAISEQGLNPHVSTVLQRVDALLEAVEVEEVAFQAGCQAGELRAIITSALANPQRKLAAMHSRIKKHLGATAPKLAAQVNIL